VDSGRNQWGTEKYCHTLAFRDQSPPPVLSSMPQGPRCCSSKRTSSSAALQSALPQVEPVVLSQLLPQPKKDARRVPKKLDREDSRARYDGGWGTAPHCSVKTINPSDADRSR
jgi:hypothetical protein